MTDKLEKTTVRMSKDDFLRLIDDAAEHWGTSYKNKTEYVRGLLHQQLWIATLCLLLLGITFSERTFFMSQGKIPDEIVSHLLSSARVCFFICIGSLAVVRARYQRLIELLYGLADSMREQRAHAFYQTLGIDGDVQLPRFRIDDFFDEYEEGNFFLGSSRTVGRACLDGYRREEQLLRTTWPYLIFVVGTGLICLGVIVNGVPFT